VAQRDIANGRAVASFTGEDTSRRVEDLRPPSRGELRPDRLNQLGEGIRPWHVWHACHFRFE
jgi:hypothetical protein